MKLFLLMLFQIFAAVICLSVMTSCKDKALVQKNEDLRVQISELKEKVGVLEEEAGEDPGDQSAMLKQAKEDLAKAIEKLESLGSEKAQLEEQKKTLEKEFQDYQSKY